jgi:hypothetical protein
MTIFELLQLLFISFFIVIFTNGLIRFAIWKKFLVTIKTKINTKIFFIRMGDLIYQWGSCIRCITFWFSLIIYAIYFYFFKEMNLNNFILYLVSTLFTMSLGIILHRILFNLEKKS